MPIAGRAAEIQVLYILAYSIIAYTAIHSLYIVYIYIYNIHVLYSYQEHHEGTQEAIPRQGVEEPVRNPRQADHPYGYQHYTLSDEEPEAVETVEDKFNESYLDKQRQHFESIDRKYQEVRGERYDIDSQLKAFKRKLELPHSVDFPREKVIVRHWLRLVSKLSALSMILSLQKIRCGHLKQLACLYN